MGIDVAAADGQVAGIAKVLGIVVIRGIDGIVRGVDGHMAACDVDAGLALDALAACTCGGDADDGLVANHNGTVYLDALGR